MALSPTSKIENNDSEVFSYEKKVNAGSNVSYPKNTDSFGPNKYIQTHAIDVPAIQKYGRTDAMWIHGGRSQTVLQWTDGCVRVFDSSMLSMQNSITEMTRAANGITRRDLLFIARANLIAKIQNVQVPIVIP